VRNRESERAARRAGGCASGRGWASKTEYSRDREEGGVHLLTSLISSLLSSLLSCFLTFFLAEHLDGLHVRRELLLMY
jgi:hypothetical protein